MRINTNMSALNTHRLLSANQVNTGRSVERLSSGLRINRAGDDAAGLSISEKMRGQIRGLNQASRNAQDTISLVQTAEGGLNETHAILQRMRELAVQAANDTNILVDRTAINDEVLALRTEIDRIAQDTEFNEIRLLNGTMGNELDIGTSSTLLAVDNIGRVSVAGAQAGTYGITSGAAGYLTMSAGTRTQTITNADGAQVLNFSEFGISIETTSAYSADTALGNIVVTLGAAGATFQIGANEGQSVSMFINDMSTVGLGIDTISVLDRVDASDAITSINDAILEVSAERSQLGAFQNRLDHTINNLGTSAENLTAAESRIRDVDMAQEMMEFTKNNILSQAAQAMLAQANQLPQGVLQLLR